MKLVGANAAETAECASLLGEALDSKRSARERLLRAIRLTNPEAARALQTQVPVATCPQADGAAPPEPLRDFVLDTLHRADTCGGRTKPVCDEDFDAIFCDQRP